MTENKIYLKLRNSMSELDKLDKSLKEFGDQLGLPKRSTCEIHLVLEELFTNIISYGYRDNDKHWVKITISLEKGKLVIQIEDDGIPFNPVDYKMPDLEKSLEGREIGGLGVYLIKQFANDILYKRSGNKNLVTIKKNIKRS